MRAIHLWAGAIGVAIFLVTGQLMRHHVPPMTELSEAVRLMFRSRHIYILLSALVNLMLGLYLELRAAGWRSATQKLGSVLAIASTALLVGAFVVEPGKSVHEELWFSHLGLYALFGGCMAHAAAGIRGLRN
jgi:hypothetical protein